MTRFHFHLLALLALAALLAPGAGRAAESYDNCTGVITALPAVIGTPGTWCVKAHLSTAITTGAAVTVNADNVTIDCNDYRLDGLAAGAGTQTSGIYANARQNVTVRNCAFRGFYRGIRFTGVNGGGHIIEDNRFDAMTNMGANVQGDGSIVRRNRIFDTGGSTVGGTSYGIYTLYNVDVIDNTVSEVAPRTASNGHAYGIYTSSNTSGSIMGNRIRGLLKDGTGANRGIYNDASGRITIHSNDLVAFDGSGTVGLRCANNQGSTKANVMNGFATGISGCTSNGGNVVVP